MLCLRSDRNQTIRNLLYVADCCTHQKLILYLSSFKIVLEVCFFFDLREGVRGVAKF